jgi:hypothetical protein
MSVVRCSGDVKINIPAVHDVLLAGIGPVDDLPGGQFDLTVDLNETECHYTFAAPNLQAKTWLRAVYDNPGQSRFDFFGRAGFSG